MYDPGELVCFFWYQFNQMILDKGPLNGFC